MKWHNFQIQIFFLSLLANLSSVKCHDKQEEELRSICLNKFKDLDRSDKVETALMISSFLESCDKDTQCPFQVDPVDVNIVHKYDTVYDKEINRMQRLCERPHEGYKLCQVTTKSVFYTDFMNVTINKYVTEENKLICYPPSCTDDQIHIVESSPAKCQPEDPDCDVLSYTLHCPDDRQIQTDGKCLNSLLSPFSRFQAQTTIEEQKLQTNCKNFYLGGSSSDLCPIEFEPINAVTHANFTDFKNDITYTIFETSCTQSGGKVCFVDLIAMNTVEGNEDTIPAAVQNMNVQNITMRSSFVNYPQCMPQEECLGMDLTEFAAEIFTETLTNMYGGSCDVKSGECSLKVTKIDCP